MRYLDLKQALQAYERGENVIRKLRELAGVNGNTAQIIEIAYDLQTGSYIEFVTGHKPQWRDYVNELSDILRQYVTSGDSVLDVGTGELTTLAGVASHCFSTAAGLYACDISWSRLSRGRSYFQDTVGMPLADRLHLFVADLFVLPFGDGAVDLVWTSHALEPNGGRELEALAELFRVARKKIILFEPSYEENTSEGRARMDHHGYIKGLPNVVQKLGGVCDEIVRITHTLNPLNPTYAYVITPPDKKPGDSFWACPSTRLPMVRQEDCFWSERSLLAYPVLKGIPVLRREAAILASGLR